MKNASWNDSNCVLLLLQPLVIATSEQSLFGQGARGLVQTKYLQLRCLPPFALYSQGHGGS
eukprot:scaffold32146_cov26-Tisochrysis_lutea.AAC.1